MAEIIRFDDEKFEKLYKSPAESPENNKRARLIYKALEIKEQIKIKEKQNVRKNNGKTKRNTKRDDS